MDVNHDELVSHFCGVTGASPSTAQTALSSTNWNIEEAVSFFYAGQDAPAEPSQSPQEADSPQPIPVVPTSQPAPTTQPPSNTRRTQQPASRMRTIHDLSNDHDGSGSESDDEPEKNFFTGGEKSGLAVQRPNRGGDNAGPSGGPTPNYFDDLLNQARRNAARPEDEEQSEQPARSSAFQGRAQTLGGDDAPSEVIEDPNARAAPSSSALPRVERTLHLWRDGFSIDDGILHRFDDPANAPVLALINQGRAPLALLDVQPGQEVDLQLDTHRDQDYVAPKKSYKPFGGSGQRLGSPTPSATTGAAPAPAPAQPAAAAQAASSSSSAQPTVNVDSSAPTITLQIRLGDGTRLQSRFNTTHTIGDVYEFVNRANAASTSRSYALMTTFPNKDMTDKAAVLGETPELKKGGVVVQKWL